MMLFVVYGVGVAVLRCLLDRFYFVSGTVCALFVYLFCVVCWAVCALFLSLFCALFVRQFVRCFWDSLCVVCEHFLRCSLVILGLVCW